MLSRVRVSSRCRALGALSAAGLILMLLSACGATPETPTETPSEPSAPEAAEVTAEPSTAELLAIPAQLPPCPEPPVDCGSGPGTDCNNYPFRPVACQPTSHGPARADIVELPTNMLYCSGGTYALCFYSGPPQPTGSDPANNNPLPCVLGADGKLADCTCEAFTSGGYFVDIYSILNRGVYLQTINVCGADGSGCPNLATCGEDGSGCAGEQQAPVCEFLNAQNAADPQASFFPGADLISAFSFAMTGDYPLPDDPPACNGLYAGCMTAPCWRQDGAQGAITDGELVQCSCPTWNGDFQIGQEGPRQCEPQGGPDDPNTYVWSASNTVPPKP